MSALSCYAAVYTYYNRNNWNSFEILSSQKSDTAEKFGELCFENLSQSYQILQILPSFLHNTTAGSLGVISKPLHFH